MKWVCDPTVSIEEGEDVALSAAGSQHAGRDQPLPLHLTHDFNHLQHLYVLVQLRMQVTCGRTNDNTNKKMMTML